MMMNTNVRTKALWTAITLVNSVLAQISSPIAIAQTISSPSLPRPNWTLQNLTLLFPWDEHASALPEGIYPKRADIEFSIVQTDDAIKYRTDVPASQKTDNVVRCAGFWDPNRPPTDLMKCADGQTYWRFGRDMKWDNKDFWIDVVRPSYIPFVPSQLTSLEYAYDFCDTVLI
jgi:hypothetical protein